MKKSKNFSKVMIQTGNKPNNITLVSRTLLKRVFFLLYINLLTLSEAIFKYSFKIFQTLK